MFDDFDTMVQSDEFAWEYEDWLESLPFLEQEEVA